MQKCLNIASTCVQLKPDDGACRAKAIVGCGKALAGIGADALKLEGTLLKACDADGQGLPDLLDLKGIGFAAEQAPCATEGTASLGTVASVAGCIRAQHSCRAEHVVAIAAPRAGELLAFAGRQPGAEFPCLGDVAGAVSGNTGVIPAPKAKALFKCGKTIEKVAVDLTKARAKSAQSCIIAGMTCLQLKSDDLLCLPKASIKCGKLLDKLNDPANGTLAKLGDKLVTVCSDPELSPFDLGGSAGLGFDAQMFRCGELGFGSRVWTASWDASTHSSSATQARSRSARCRACGNSRRSSASRSPSSEKARGASSGAGRRRSLMARYDDGEWQSSF